MKKLNHKKLTHCVIAALIGASSSIYAASTETLIFPKGDMVSSGGVTVHNQILAYLKANQKKLGLFVNVEELTLTSMKSSLTADHYRFEQRIDGIPVWNSVLSVSVSKSDGGIQKIHNATQKISAQVKTQRVYGKLSANKALELSWNSLYAQGELYAKPESKLYWYKQGNQLTQVYVTHIELSQPSGSWRHIVDAQSGKILDVFRMDTPHKKDEFGLSGKNKLKRLQEKLSHKFKSAGSLNDALIAFENKQAQKQHLKSLNAQYAVLADATALVFDPDPRTTLNDASLEQDSPAASFDPAYQSVTLRDVDLTGGIYSLTGPWVTIVDFEAPNTRPTTTNDGNWTGKRGDPQFYDAMTYYHIDQNQRYIQSLGFTGQSGIQEGSIEADADGVSGGDNSYYLPQSNQLSFGHGCVPDNEDADVILHEYGHAIHSNINSDWGGGDTGAMGEGFGDYWAGSYSYSTPNGASFNPAWIYTWDGHNNCWTGRNMNRTSYQYDPDEIYVAHMTINNIADYGDDLWSTPLFQAMVDFTNNGGAREEMDQIVLEAQFGLGPNIQMPDMAQSILNAATTLFPNGTQAGFFFKHFHNMNFLTETLERKSIVVESARANNLPDPGETVSFKIPFENKTPVTATSVTATLTTRTSGVVLPVSTSAYTDIAGGATRSNSTDFQVQIPEQLACGEPVSLTMALTYDLSTLPAMNQSETLSFNWFTGNRTALSFPSTTSSNIPDNDPSGVSSVIDVSGVDTNGYIDNNFSINLDVSHTWRGDVKISLVSPAGTEVLLFDTHGDDSKQNIVGNFPNDLTPLESLSAFAGEDFNGSWTLKVIDEAAQDVGVLNSWSISVTENITCEAPPEESDGGSKNALYGLAAIILIGVEAGSMHLGLLILLFAGVRRRHK